MKRHCSQKQGTPPVDGDASRPSELPQENQDVLEKLREMKLGSHIDHTLSISIGRRPFARISDVVTIEDFHHPF